MSRVATALLACAIPIAAASTAQAGPIQVHPIIVCQSGGVCPGGNPSDPSSVYSQILNQSVLDRIFAQTAGTDAAGVSYPGASFVLQSPVTLTSTAFSTVVVDIAGNPLDSAHQLIRGAGHLQAAEPTTLNVFLVDDIKLVSGPTPLRSIPGYGLISGNGLVISKSANVDTLAHELGHNLGLGHVDGKAWDDPNDLMRSAARNAPSTPGDGRIATSIDLLTGTAANDQVAKANQALFTVNLASASVGTRPGDCKRGALNCGLSIISNVAPTTESLIGVRLRWLDASAVSSAVIDTPIDGVNGLGSDVSDRLGCDQTDFSLAPLANPGGVPGGELHITFPAGCMSPGIESGVAFGFLGQSDNGNGPGLYFAPPFSVQFDFADGSTSIAGYDETTGASTSSTVAVSAIDRSLVAADLFIEDALATDVPEPASWMVLIFALASLACRARSSTICRPTTGVHT